MTTRSPLLLAAAVTGLLAACGPAASNDAPSTPAPVAPVAVEGAAADSSSNAVPTQTAEAPRPTEGYDWDSRLNDEERTRSMVLAYEVPNTDDQPLNLSCEEGGQRIFASTHTGKANLRSFTLASVGARQDYAVVRSGDNEPMGGFYVTAELAGDDPALAAFRDSGWMRLTIDGRTTDMAAQPTSDARRKIAAFMAFCNA